VSNLNPAFKMTSRRTITVDTMKALKSKNKLFKRL